MARKNTKVELRPDQVLLNGNAVHKSWPAKLEQAQRQTHIKFGRRTYLRDRYGYVWGEKATHACHDCAAMPGQYHLVGCDVERCPKCSNQLISCDCHGESTSIIVLEGKEKTKP